MSLYAADASLVPRLLPLAKKNGEEPGYETSIGPVFHHGEEPGYKASIGPVFHHGEEPGCKAMPMPYGSCNTRTLNFEVAWELRDTMLFFYHLHNPRKYKQKLHIN